eukprot:CAMPEP_0194391494 /NCGR_PEP_ID=MMETSP0174-20130528/115889_1 /TAXON_ID=216777 /ORGANISM="Proboscia alata, Strain PI-D3" /LENGTH=54 /DNA_ID=CAMNT_0039185853 /DNA_START=1 /DNA_END=162 /DNA_ORIENTATION=-
MSAGRNSKGSATGDSKAAAAAPLDERKTPSSGRALHQIREIVGDRPKLLAGVLN